MLLPIHDQNPLRIIPFQIVTIGIIAICVAMFLWQISLSEGEKAQFILSFGVIPSVLLENSTLPPELMRIPSEYTILTSIFLHAGWMHLLGNMLFLWVYGDNIEDAMGHTRFLAFYLLCGVAATVTYTVVNPGSENPLVGASGAIAGVMGAYLMLHPKVRVIVLVLYRIPVPLPAYAVLALWLFVQIAYVVLDAGGNVAWWAHIGGFVAGVILVVPFRRKHIPLFDRGVPH